jgi:D-alanyl-D-alanine carboxypeptidase
LSLGQYLPVSENASYQSPSKLCLRSGQQIRVEDAILGLVTESANDAAVVLAEALGGSESGFAQLMTHQARALGMTRTLFRNPSGLPDPYQVTTARDMAILGAALINHYPQYYPYFSRESFTYAGIYHQNHNHLMDRYDGMDGIKTGYIRASGFNLVASVKRGNTRLVGVVFGGRSAIARDNHMAQLLDQCFAATQTEASLSRLAPASGEGDSGDNVAADQDDVVLPAKVAAAFPPRGIQAPQVQQKTRHAAAAPKARAGGGTWGVQIGAYSDASVGRQALTTLVSSMSGLSGHASPQVQKVATGGGVVMYRARLMSLNKETAQGICSYLTQRGKSCLTVEP